MTESDFSSNIVAFLTIASKEFSPLKQVNAFWISYNWLLCTFTRNGRFQKQTTSLEIESWRKLWLFLFVIVVAFLWSFATKPAPLDYFSVAGSSRTRMVIYCLSCPDAKTGRQLFVTVFQIFNAFIVISYKVFIGCKTPFPVSVGKIFGCVH